MNEMFRMRQTETGESPVPSRRPAWPWASALIALLAAGAGWYYYPRGGGPVGAGAPPPPEVTVSTPVKRDLDTQIGFLGQFSPVNVIELRAQVGGTLTEIHFQDGQMVKKGDLLFAIDARPYQIKLEQAKAQFEQAKSRLDLAKVQFARAQTLRKSEFASQETVDQRSNDQAAAQAAIDDAQSRINDAQLDLDYCRVTAPFTGRIGARQVSLGALIAGSRAGTGPTTLLATLVSLDPIYLNFDMSEADYLTFARERARREGALKKGVLVGLGDENDYPRNGTLDFVDNVVNRASGTIRARATLANPDLFLTPGTFARLKLQAAPPAPTLLVPDEVVTLDQSRRGVLTVGPDGTVALKPVVTGDKRLGLRVVRSGLADEDRVIIDGMLRAAPGAKVTPKQGTIAFGADAQD